MYLFLLKIIVILHFFPVTWSPRVYATCPSVRLISLKNWFSHSSKISTMSSTSSTEEECPQWQDRTPSLSLVWIFWEQSIVFPFFNFFCCSRYVYPEKEEILRRQQGPEELGQHQHGAAGRAENHGDKYWRSSAKRRGSLLYGSLNYLCHVMRIL